MTILSEVVLIITLGYSPSGATYATQTVLEYPQVSMEACMHERKQVIQQDPPQFAYHALCVRRAKGATK